MEPTMDLTQSPESPLATRSIDITDTALPRRRGRPSSSRGKVRVASDSRVGKPSISRHTPDIPRTLHLYNSSLPVERVLFPKEGCQESLSAPPRGRSVTESSAGDVTPLPAGLRDHGLRSGPIDNEPNSTLLRSTASAPEVPQALQAQRYESMGAERPRGPRKSKSEPSPRSQPSSASQVDSMLADLIKKPLSKTEANRKNVGNNYVFQVVTALGSGERIVKVGSTKGLEKLRLDKIAVICQHMQIEHQEDPEHVPIRLYDRAEKLAHRELSAFLHKFDCECGVDHHEYFAVDPDVARDAVRRWREFCRQEPYDNQGQLREFWEYRIRYMQRCGKFETIHDHAKRAERWKAFLSPTDLEKIQFDFSRLYYKLWDFRWQALALIEAVVIVIVSFPSFTAVLGLVCVFFWVIVELLQLQLPLVFEVFQKKTKHLLKWLQYPDPLYTELKGRVLDDMLTTDSLAI